MCRFSPRLRNAGFVLLLVAMATGGTFAGTYKPHPETGISLGFMSQCNGVMKNTTITENALRTLQVFAHTPSRKGMVTNGAPVMLAADMVARNKKIDFKKRKTIMHFSGYIDHGGLEHARTIGRAYTTHGYNVLFSHTTNLFSSYPRIARMAREIGNKYGDFLVELTKQGLRAEDLHLVGISLGGHIASYTAKRFYNMTGKKPGRLTGLDPAGPCFRSMPPEERFTSSDAELVDVLHTNSEGLGMAERLGQVDFYANGGEYQPPLSLYLPCLILCSHLKSFMYWWISFLHPDKFVAVKCDSIQDARNKMCFNNTETNLLGPKIDFGKPGIYYLPVDVYYPFYRGEDGLKERGESRVDEEIRKINAAENLVVHRGRSLWEVMWNIISFP